jgi:2,3-bisphosphoglycerate-dependent phosphoglycerate mutase
MVRQISHESPRDRILSRNIGQLVIVRHGESEWNKKNLFTGWRDVRLTEQGIEEARAAGRLMAKEGFHFDLTYTSLLRRAIHTLGLALEEMDQMWLPVEKHWRLNERHYGALQGKDKKEAVQKFGEEQVLIWRRSYATPPPPVDVDSPDYPRSDRRYAHLTDAELPRSESLKDVLERVLPYWEKTIVPQLAIGKTVLIVAHGNSLRALMKHLESISEEDIVKLDLPTGEPRAYRLNDQFKAAEARYLNDPAEIARKAQAVKNQTGKA